MKTVSGFCLPVILLILLILSQTPAMSAEIAVAIRYLGASGKSHSQIYLFQEDGTLLRQLTQETTGQAKYPVFSPDGKQIVFTESLPGGRTTYWSVQPKTGKLRQLPSKPRWYAAAKTSDYFEEESDTDIAKDSDTRKDVDQDHLLGVYTTPDGTQRLTLIASDDGDDEGKLFELKNLRTGEIVKLGNLPGFEVINWMLFMHGKASQGFLISPPLRVAFFGIHLNSSDGNTVYAVDLAGLKIVRLSPNDAVPVPLPGEPAFLCYAEERYREVGPDTKITANCSYIDLWDASLKRTRFGSDIPAVCYGASMHREGVSPATITIFCKDLGTNDGAPLSGY